MINEEKDGYDIIGDVHGCASSLQRLLLRLNYHEKDGHYCYNGDAQRTVIFLGDLIDRGPEIRETIALVKAMVDAGTAQMILGNHEFSAIAYHTPIENGFLRAHNARSHAQINATLQQFVGFEAQWQEYLQWFKTLPLFLEFDDFRVVHACWDTHFIESYQSRFNTHCISAQRIAECVDVTSLEFQTIDRLTRGISLPLPKGHTIVGRDGFTRHSFRVNFWHENPCNYDDVHFQPDQLPSELSNRELTEQEKKNICQYGVNEKLLFIGHYWLQGDPKPVAKNIACLDYSAVHNGKLVAYRIDNGDTSFRQSAFVSELADCEKHA